MIEMFFRFILLSLTCNLVQVIEIKDQSFFCRDENDFVDFFQVCKKSGDSILDRFDYLECEFKKQLFKIRSFNEDSYFKFEGSVYHVVNGSVRNTNCELIDKIEVHEKVKKCNKDVLVSFYFESNLVFGYSTNENIIRPKSKLEACSNELKHISFNNVSLVKKANSIYPTQLKRLHIGSNAKQENSFLAFYEKYFEVNREFRFSSDILLSITFLINLAIFCMTKQYASRKF
jgi:hypothetical protein